MFNYEDGKPYDIDFEAFAKSFKAYGATIKKPEEIVPTLKDALKSGMTAVINAYVDPETAPPLPGKWELPKPEYLLRKLKT